MSKEEFVPAISQGTTSSRAIIFNHSGRIVTVGQEKFTQILPDPGWVERDPVEIWESVHAVVTSALQKAEINASHLVAVGITNQHETTTVWGKSTGEPVYNALIWQGVRTGDIAHEIVAGNPLGTGRYRQITGENVSTYPSATKVKWILNSVEGAHERTKAEDLLFSTSDTWALWNLAGGVNGGVHAIDVADTSRILLIDVRELKWREDICGDLGIPVSMPPEIKPPTATYGRNRSNGLLADVPVSGTLGDQQAAAFNRARFEPGTTENTYGTSCSTPMSAGIESVFPKGDLLTTVLCRLDNETPVYTFRGSIVVASSLVQWLRSNFGMIVKSSDIDALAELVKNSDGVYFAPAFPGLFVPYWCDDARSAIVGLTCHMSKGHIAHAIGKSATFQFAELIEVMNTDAGVPLREPKIDGSMTYDELLMQFRADISGCDVVRPAVVETTALDIAHAAGITVGFWSSTEDVVASWQEDKCWSPSMDKTGCNRACRLWRRAITHTLGWVDEDVK